MRFTDVWFDNFFSDFAVQSRIKDALSQAESVLAAVAAAHDRLATATQGVDARLGARRGTTGATGRRSPDRSERNSDLLTDALDAGDHLVTYSWSA